MVDAMAVVVVYTVGRCGGGSHGGGLVLVRMDG